MFRILVKYVVGEIAINTMFQMAVNNFIKPKLENLLKECEITKCPYNISIKGGDFNLSNISDDIKYFERQREKEVERGACTSRYDNMIKTLKDAEGAYRYITVESLSKEEAEKHVKQCVKIFSRSVKPKSVTMW